jgi:hypothetical protein
MPLILGLSSSLAARLTILSTSLQMMVSICAQGGQSGYQLLRDVNEASRDNVREVKIGIRRIKVIKVIKDSPNVASVQYNLYCTDPSGIAGITGITCITCIEAAGYQPTGAVVPRACCFPWRQVNTGCMRKKDYQKHRQCGQYLDYPPADILGSLP